MDRTNEQIQKMCAERTADDTGTKKRERQANLEPSVFLAKGVFSAHAALQLTFNEFDGGLLSLHHARPLPQLLLQGSQLGLKAQQHLSRLYRENVTLSIRLSKTLDYEGTQQEHSANVSDMQEQFEAPASDPTNKETGDTLVHK
jgi:hypothetical protein